MKTSVSSGILWILLAFFSVGVSVSSFGALGSTADSIQADQAHMNASVKVTEANAYTVHEMKSGTGTVVREYVSRSEGKVFGIAWQGPFIPSMRQLLGMYFEQYSRAANARRGSKAGRRFLYIQEPGLVVQTAGHMLAFSGRAYDPGLLPAGVSASDIQ